MDLGHLYLVTHKTAPADPGDLVAAGRALGTGFPAGYAEVARYGPGSTCGYFRVHPAAQVADRTREWRARIADNWFWDTEEAGVEAEALQTRGVLFADTYGGDEFCFVAGEPERCFFLPHEDEEADLIDDGLVGVLRSFTDDAHEPPPTFESWIDRGGRGFRGPAGDRAVVYDALLGLGLHDLVHVSDDGTVHEVYVQAVGASITLTGSGDHVLADVRHDTEAPADVLDRIVGVLAAHGLR